jgi:spore coat polysaccharide biosynthesis protein SpsF
LPGKILKEIKGKTLIEYEIDRIKKSKYIDKIVVATSIDKSNDALEDLCGKIKIDCFRGEENDVLKRYYDCSQKYNDFEYIVRVTGDCPLIDTDILDNTIEKFLEANVDY